MYLKIVTIGRRGTAFEKYFFFITKGPLFIYFIRGNNTVLKCQGMHARWLPGYDPDSNGNNNIK